MFKKFPVPKVIEIKQEKEEEKMNEDPTFGRPNGFFVIYPEYRLLPINAMHNPQILTFEQLSFVYTYYPEFVLNPIKIMTWLFYYTFQTQFQFDETFMNKTAPRDRNCPYN